MNRHWLSLKNRLRYHPLCRRLKAWAAEKQAALIFGADASSTVQKIEHLCSAIRLLDGAAKVRQLEQRLLKLRDETKATRAEWATALAGRADFPVLLKKATILKPWVSAQEPGVIFISFEHQWAQLLLLPEMEQFARDYTLVVSPTWSPPHTALNVVFPTLWPRPVHCLISHEEDLITLPHLSANYRMLPLLASHWVDGEMYQPRPHAERDIDLVMLANFAPYKRHYLLFEALRQMPRHLKIVLVGRPNGTRDDHVLMQEAAAYGVSDRFELRYRVEDDVVVDSLCRAKASVILSQREGSCVAVIESMIANTPIGLVKGSHIGSARYVTQETGVFLDEACLAEQLLELIERSSTMNPRAAALEAGLEARLSSRVMNEHLKQSAIADGQVWTRDIVEMHWRPNPQRLHPEDDTWAVPEHHRITQRYAVMVGRQKE